MVNIQSPMENQILNSNNVWLNFILTKPNDWFEYYPAGVDIKGNALYLIRANITSINYTIDDGEPHAIPTNESQYYTSSFPKHVFEYNTNLTLDKGMHKIQVIYEAECFYLITVTYTAENTTLSHNIGTYPVNYSSVKMYGTTEPIAFAIAPFILAPENVIYNESTIPLTIVLDNSITTWVGYSLDGKGNVTVTGNTTLTGLSNGEHNIKVFTNDTLGNIYSSQSTNFTIDVPSKPFPTVTVATVSAVVVVVVVAGLLVYHKRKTKTV